jgi:hypothetical protein
VADSRETRRRDEIVSAETPASSGIIRQTARSIGAENPSPDVALTVMWPWPSSVKCPVTFGAIAAQAGSPPLRTGVADA